ncbi:uncharacterized protein LOC124587782 isoform X1 [Schistocerca americana]|uniref:uncharacterized protein LOC124587782 isoform X1 n=1 Tax=Schistocerca americana TaxID=7009 RepID=UPI001F4F56B8|nr:uncharacterized protein LOC124587782 isoform X1 [Schistocerca americana]XP_049944565.1 uncharacterized protein LOC126426690 isoform X1 [Schistocerca serialis cubense]XP_049944567.1 uncharacterized protein LOC126426691 isoform X1 [Schistocerca serialis cubense]XP_049944570.1 uncharacterized protein LOC126426693 isoform X2 [Schistocerca serialis cubense]
MNSLKCIGYSYSADHVNPAKKRLLIMDTKKSDCPATFSIKCVKVYPGYSVQSVDDREIKKKVVHSLKQALEAANKPESVLRFYVRASPPDHHTHSTESIKASGDIHPLLAVEIAKVVEDGTTSVRIIKLHLERFVNITFTGPHKPDNMNTTFYPKHLTIYSHVYRALKKLKKSVFDQEALQMQVNEWQKEYRGDNIFFQAFFRC